MTVSYATRRLIRFLTRWAWDDLLLVVAKLEYNYGRNDDGSPKDWTEWNAVRSALREVRRLRAPWELDNHQKLSPLGDSPATRVPPAAQAADAPARDAHLCSYCRGAEVQRIKASELWDVEHWQCPLCDSTFCDWEYPQ